MTNQEFLTLMDQEFEAIKKLFDKKGKGYGGRNDVLFNFKTTAERIFGDASYENMFKVAEIYKDKHNVSLAKGIHTTEVRERLLDNIIYSFFQLAMIQKAFQSDELTKQQTKPESSTKQDPNEADKIVLPDFDDDDEIDKTQIIAYIKAIENVEKDIKNFFGDNLEK